MYPAPALLINGAASYISRNFISCCHPAQKPIAATPRDLWESKMAQGHVTTQDSDSLLLQAASSYIPGP